MWLAVIILQTGFYGIPGGCYAVPVPAGGKKVARWLLFCLRWLLWYIISGFVCGSLSEVVVKLLLWYQRGKPETCYAVVNVILMEFLAIMILQTGC